MERSSHLTRQLLPASSWAAPIQIGKPPEKPRLHGVGLAIKETLLAFVEPPVAGTERILALRMSTESGPANIISAYAPTLCSPPGEEDAFYEALVEMISGIPNSDAIYLLGDFNARVGADHGAWPSCLSVHRRSKINDNGQRLLELCCFMASVGQTPTLNAKTSIKCPGDIPLTPLASA